MWILRHAELRPIEDKSVTPKRYMLTAGIIISVQMGLLAGVYANAGTQGSDSTDLAEPKSQANINLALRFTSQPQAKTDSGPMSTAPLKSDQLKQAPINTAVIKNAVIKKTSMASATELPEPKKLAPKLKPEHKPSPKSSPKTAKIKPTPTRVQASTNVDKPNSASPISPSAQAEASNNQDSMVSTSAHQTLDKPLALAKPLDFLKPQGLLKPKFSAPPTKPNYPRLARKRGLQGTALVEVLFDNLGKQLELSLVDSSGAAILDKAALDAVKLWQFSPPSPQSALAYRVQVPVTFALN